MPALLQSARREAEASFGDGNVYLEKLLEGARHIEFQILADVYGNVIHLGERECSLQRRHQKILEESPSTFIGNNNELRQQIGMVAVKAAQAVGYTSAGTIEFLIDQENRYYFLEMNTRLQVEHPVTEMVTGLDIVKEQIKIASGQKLPYKQKELIFKGWAIECRVNAEDPYNNFLPSTGKIEHILLPTGPGIRIDTGVYTGFEITPYYDSLISKLIVWGETRSEAILRLHWALEEYKILGVRTNIPFHQRLIDSQHFISGQFDTRFIEERFSLESADDSKGLLPDIAAIMATLVANKTSQRAANIIQRSARDTINWKWYDRWERKQR
jgi:acetyl-CoA carboxylase biotin carboxylase subunit